MFGAEAAACRVERCPPRAPGSCYEQGAPLAKCVSPPPVCTSTSCSASVRSKRPSGVAVLDEPFDGAQPSLGRTAEVVCHGVTTCVYVSATGKYRGGSNHRPVPGRLYTVYLAESRLSKRSTCCPRWPDASVRALPPGTPAGHGEHSLAHLRVLATRYISNQKKSDTSRQ